MLKQERDAASADWFIMNSPTLLDARVRDIFRRLPLLMRGRTFARTLQ